MIYSERDLARKVARDLSASSISDFTNVSSTVETALSLLQEGRPTRFDLGTSVTLGGFIVKVAEFAYKVWQDRQKDTKRFDQHQEKEELRKKLKAELGKISVDDHLLEAILDATMQVLSTELSKKNS